MFPVGIQGFAEVFISSQEKRELADYDPTQRRLTKMKIVMDILVVSECVNGPAGRAAIPTNFATVCIYADFRFTGDGCVVDFWRRFAQ